MGVERFIFDAEATQARAGVLTPATAMGEPLIARLRHAGHRYEWADVT